MEAFVQGWSLTILLCGFIVRPPVRFGDADCTLRLPAPRLGEHSRAILREAGLAEPEIEALFTSKIAIEAAPDQPAAAKTVVGTRST